MKYFWLLILLPFISCEKKIEFVDDSQDLPFFVNAVLEVNDYPILHFGKNSSINDSVHFNYICDAQVKIKENEYFLNLGKTIKNNICIYEDTLNTIKANKNYKLSLMYKNNELTAETKTPFQYAFSLNDISIHYKDMKIRTNFDGSKIFYDTIYLYLINLKISIDKKITKDEKRGFSVNFLDKSIFLSNMSVLGKTTISPRIYNKIDKLIIDDFEDNTYLLELNLSTESKNYSTEMYIESYVIDKNMEKYIVSARKVIMHCDAGLYS